MFHGIEVDVVDGVLQIVPVANQSLPVAALPETAFSLQTP